MIILDTNVVSETFRQSPSPRVLGWLGDQPDTALFTTAITEAEVLYGAALLPAGRRRHALEAFIEQVFKEDFAGRILPFDSAAAREYADISAGRRRAGRPIGEADARIAAIVRSRGASLATRNVQDFTGCELTLVDPWQ